MPSPPIPAPVGGGSSGSAQQAGVTAGLSRQVNQLIEQIEMLRNDLRKVAIEARIAIGRTESVASSYTPTLTNVANLGASTAYRCVYHQVDSFVMVAGRVDIDPTAGATLTQLGITLPVESNFAQAYDCCGTAFAPGIASQGAAILADTTNNRAQLEYISADITNQPMYFTFGYFVI